MEPLPRTLNRLAAPRFDFILGMTYGFLLSFSMTPGGLLRRRLMPRLSLVSCLGQDRLLRGGGFCRRLLLCLRLGFGLCLFLHRRRLLLRPQHHHHLPALALRELLDQADCVEILLPPIEQALAEFLVRHLAPAEPQRHLGLVALLEELDQ